MVFTTAQNFRLGGNRCPSADVSATQLNRLLLRRLSLNTITRGAVTLLLLLALLLLGVFASGQANTFLLTALLIEIN